MSDPIPVTKAWAAQLRDGTLVRVVWSGGNGPHDYVIDVDRFGVRRIAHHNHAGPRGIVGALDDARSIEVLHEPEPNVPIAVDAMLLLSPADFAAALATLSEERCMACGTDRLPCHCENDE